MTIIVCPLSQVARLVKLRAPERIVSLLDPEYDFPHTGPEYLERHLRLPVHDIPAPVVGLVAPTAAHMADLLEFLRGWTSTRPILIHCFAGFSRSTATAFITACLHNPDIPEVRIANALRHASPLARPNLGLARLADAALGRNGRLAQAAVDLVRTWPGCDRAENDPFEMPGVFDAR